MNFRKSNVLISAGPTWARIDAVRSIGNSASGETGFLLARECVRRGAKVTILLGPVCAKVETDARVTVKRFTFFDELNRLLEREVRSGKYACVIHAAAVCDYLPARVSRAKIPSGRAWNLQLVPAPKIIDRIKQWDPRVYLIGFKYEPECAEKRLTREARCLMKRSGADLVVANTVKHGSYRASLVAAQPLKTAGPFRTKVRLAAALVRHMEAQ